MSKRLVVCMRWRPGGEGQETQSFASVAEAALERMAALGGRLILWHPEWLAVDFSLEALQDAIDFIVDSPAQGVGTGFAYGPLTEVLDGGPMLAVCSGPTVERAVSLARMARAGEVLVEPALVKASGGELLVRGGRVATIGSSKLRGLKLDLAHPQRSLECESVARLAPAPWCGPMPSLSSSAGQLSLIVAARGGGGSRFLAEHRNRHHPGALVLSRLAFGYPQAALSAVFDAAHEGAGLSPENEATLAALRGGECVRLEQTSALLAEWIERHALPRIVYLSDAGEIDADSLEAVASLATAHGVAVIAGVDDEAKLPPALAKLAIAGRAVLSPLESKDASALLRRMTGDQLSQELAERLAARGMPYPLGVTQSLVEALDSVSYLWADHGVVPRVVRDETPEQQSTESLLRRRLHLVELNDRLLLEALAVLGGRAHTADIVALLRLAGRTVTNAEAALAYLERVGWLSSGPGEWVRLATRTQRSVVISQLSDRRYALLHQAAATLRAEGGKPLALASAALHAGLAGNRGKASLLAKRAAQSLRAAGLEATAFALEQYAQSADTAALRGRLLAGSWADDHRHTQASQDEQFLDASLTAEADSGPQAAKSRPVSSRPRDSNPSQAPEPRSTAREDLPPPNVSEPLPPEADAEQISETDLEAMSADDIELVPSSEEPEGAVAVATDLPEANSKPNGGQRATPTAPTMRIAGIPSDSESLMPERAALALGRGDPVTLDELAAQLRGEAHSVVADRLDAMAQLVRGNVGDALRLLREAKERANRAGPSERCRASLALSIAIAAAGRPGDALLEVLEGLACARRAGDVRGERACAKFTAQLAERAGHPSVAAAWQAASARVSVSE